MSKPIDPEPQRRRQIDPSLLRGLTQPRWSRRAFLGGAGAAGASALLAACGVQGASKPAGQTPNEVQQFWAGKTKAGILNFANWPLYIDVAKVGGKTTHPTLDEFTKQTGIKVNYKEVIQDNDSFIGKITPSLKAGQDTGWDLMVITNGGSIEKLIRLGYLTPLDHSKLPTWNANAGARFKNPDYDPGNKYSIAWQSGFTGIAYNPKLTKRPITSIQDLWDPAFKGRIAMFGDTVDTPTMAMIGLGIDPAKSTEADWKRAADKLKEQKPLLRKYIDNAGEADVLSSGEVAISMAYSGDIYQLNNSGAPGIKFVIPKEGVTLWTDNLCIPLHAAHPVDAIMYMDFVYQPRIAATLAENIDYITPVPAAKPIVLQDAAKAKGADKATLEGLADSPLVFPSDADLAKTFRYRVLTPEEQTVWDRIFQPIIQG
jgi:spermidine/putrescine transport system substrate-binding protein